MPRRTIGILASLLAFRVLATPNVILVMADDMGWAQTGYYDHPVLETPNLDAMAANGLRMDRFYSAAPQCSTARATVLTGRTNDRTGVATVGSSINKQENTLSAAFRNAGYTTAHFGKWHLNTVNTPDHPMPLSDPHHPGELGFDYWLSETNQFNLDPLFSRNGTTERIEGESSEILVDEALAFIEQAHEEGKPAFVLIWYASPHRPFEALDADMAAFEELPEASRVHHGEIVAMDRSIGMLRQGLRDL
ncbi:MAG: sulfatase-like hydrolase/transferase, partial [Gammaproteobacteria bacterium]|nr:sulfatase-like hydrolase/transferase [Gammaproteobacteria bacterium]